MKISDLDIETKGLIVCATIVARDPSEHNLYNLRKIVEIWNKKHASERAKNLLNGLGITKDFETIQ